MEQVAGRAEGGMDATSGAYFDVLGVTDPRGLGSAEASGVEPQGAESAVETIAQAGGFVGIRAEDGRLQRAAAVGPSLRAEEAVDELREPKVGGRRLVVTAEATRAGRGRLVAFAADTDAETFLVLGDDGLGQLLDLRVAQVREAIPVAGVFRIAGGWDGVLSGHGTDETGVILLLCLQLGVAEEGLPGLDGSGVHVEGSLVEEHGGRAAVIVEGTSDGLVGGAGALDREARVIKRHPLEDEIIDDRTQWLDDVRVSRHDRLGSESAITSVVIIVFIIIVIIVVVAVRLIARMIRERSGRAFRAHPRGEAGKEEAVPEGGVEEIGLIELRPVGAVVLQYLGGVNERAGEAVADGEQGLLVADSEVSMRVLGERGRLHEGNLGQDDAFIVVTVHRCVSISAIGPLQVRLLDDRIPVRDRASADAEARR